MMRKIILLVLFVTILASCLQEVLNLETEKIRSSFIPWVPENCYPVLPGWTMEGFYKRFVRDNKITDEKYKSLCAFDIHTESSFKSLANDWLERLPILKSIAYRVFYENGNEAISMGFDTSLKSEDNVGAVYNKWGIYFLRRGEGPHVIARDVFTHELVHAFQHKALKYNMNVDEPFIEFETDIVTDALEFLYNSYSYPEKYESMLFRDVHDSRIKGKETQYLKELNVLVLTGKFNTEKITEFYVKWYKEIHGNNPPYVYAPRALGYVVSWWEHASIN